LPDTEPASPESRSERRFDYQRTVALSDGVFAIALTLLVLNLTVPRLGPDQHDRLWSVIRDHQSEFFSYGLSFAVIGLLWVRHHAFFRELREVDLSVTLLNLLYLGLIAFLPYPTELLGDYGDQTAAVAIYAGTIVVIGVVTMILRGHVLRARLLTESGHSEMARVSYARAAVPLVFLASIPIAFASPQLAVYTWALTALIPRFTRRLAGRVSRRNQDPAD
jgi:uncharacterized membrane protein